MKSYNVQIKKQLKRLGYCVHNVCIIKSTCEHQTMTMQQKRPALTLNNSLIVRILSASDWDELRWNTVQASRLL